MAVQTEALMRKMIQVLLLLPFLLQAQDKPALQAIVSDTNTPPYAIFAADASLQAGLSKDIIDEVGRRLNRPVSYLNLPRTRVEQWLVQGKADLACFLNPDWVSEPATVDWTAPLFSTQQLLVRRRDASPITAIQHLAGKRVGTTWGFTYPELEQVFRLGDVHRDDAYSLETNLLRLKQQRLDVVMTVDLSYLYYVKTTAEQSFSADPLWAPPAAVYCALSQHSSAAPKVLQQQFSQLVQTGFIQQRLAFYTGRPEPH